MKLEGIYQGVDDNGNWLVNGVEISLDHLTRLEGTPVIGSAVEIKGVLRDGKIIALRIEVEDETEDFRGQPQNRVKLRGMVDAMSADGSIISVNAHRVHIGDLTEIDGNIFIGVDVRILAILLDNGMLVAREIDVRERSSDDGDED